MHLLSTLASAPLEILGIGPEMFADRGKAWVEALAVVLETLIAKIGVLVLAALAVRKTILSNRENREVKERLDRQGARIDNALSPAPTPITSSVS